MSHQKTCFDGAPRVSHPFDQPAKLFVFRAGSVDGKTVAHQVGGGARAGEAGLFWKGAVSNDKQSLKVLMDTSEWVYHQKRATAKKTSSSFFSEH